MAVSIGEPNRPTMNHTMRRARSSLTPHPINWQNVAIHPRPAATGTHWISTPPSQGSAPLTYPATSAPAKSNTQTAGGSRTAQSHRTSTTRVFKSDVDGTGCARPHSGHVTASGPRTSDVRSYPHCSQASMSHPARHKPVGHRRGAAGLVHACQHRAPGHEQFAGGAHLLEVAAIARFPGRAFGSHNLVLMPDLDP